MYKIKIEFYRYLDNYTCIPVTALQDTSMTPTYTASDIEEHILNFHFTSLDNGWKPSINGIQNVLPSPPLQVNVLGMISIKFVIFVLYQLHKNDTF